jgi:outer membrane protein
MLSLGLSIFLPSASFPQAEPATEPTKEPAPEQPGKDAPQARWSLGAAVVVRQQIYRDIKRDGILFRNNFAVPFFSYENTWVSIGIPRADFKIYSTKSMSFRLRARYDGDGYDPDDSPFLSGMAERKSTAWVGGAFLWNAGIVNVSVEVLHDALQYSKGSRAAVQVERRFGFGAFGLTPRLGVDWYDGKYVDYYYGVRASEATAARGAYTGAATAALHAGLRLDFSPVPRHTIFLDVGAKRFGSGITDSPIVARSSQTAAGIGYVYRF